MPSKLICIEEKLRALNFSGKKLKYQRIFLLMIAARKPNKGKAERQPRMIHGESNGINNKDESGPTKDNSP